MQLSPGREYERYVASLFHPNEFYVERGVNHFREQVLEVDGLFTDCRDVSMPRIVVECKTGAGFFRHLFKMGGQLSHLRFPRGYFFHQDAEKNAFVVEEVAKHYGDNREIAREFAHEYGAELIPALGNNTVPGLQARQKRYCAT